MVALAGHAYVFPTDSVSIKARFQWSDLGDDGSLLDIEALATLPTSVHTDAR